MITYIQRKNLEVCKYNACIENSRQSKIYAFSWYLDSVADNWGVLVLNNYEAVMPIPWKQKYFLKYATQPFFCQQLGVFSKKIISEELQTKMIKQMAKKFVKISLNFNADNFQISKMIEKNNYTLALNKPYETMFLSFSKRRKRSIKIGAKSNLTIKKTTILELIKMKKEFYTHINFPEKVIKELANSVLKKNNGFILGVFKDDVLLGGSLFLKTKNRIIYLFSAYNTEARKLQASSFLINNIIKKYENTNFTLDFEGSNLPNIASFFKSFGAKNENYFHLTQMNFSTFFYRK